MSTALSPQELETLAFYEARAEQFTRNRKQGIQGYWRQELDRFNYYLPQGSIIELGCGGGVEATYLSERLDYLGTDLSEEFVHIARGNNPGLVFKALSLYDLSSIRREFDGFWCCATLMHIPKHNLANVLADLRGLLRKGGVGFISIQSGRGEHMEISSFAPNLPRRLFAYYEPAEFRLLLHGAGFNIIRQEMKNSPGFAKDRRQITWLSYYLRAA